MEINNQWFIQFGDLPNESLFWVKQEITEGFINHW